MEPPLRENVPLNGSVTTGKKLQHSPWSPSKFFSSIDNQ